MSGNQALFLPRTGAAKDQSILRRHSDEIACLLGGDSCEELTVDELPLRDGVNTRQAHL